MADPSFCAAIMANIPIASDAETEDFKTGTFLKLSDRPPDFQAHFNAAIRVRRNRTSDPCTTGVLKFYFTAAKYVAPKWLMALMLYTVLNTPTNRS